MCPTYTYMYTAMAKICTGELVCKIGFAQGICTGICQQGPLGSAIREMDGMDIQNLWVFYGVCPMGRIFYFILLKMELILWLQHCQKKFQWVIYNIINIFVKCLKSTVQQLSNHLLKYIKNYNFKFLSGPNSFTLHCKLNNL